MLVEAEPPKAKKAASAPGDFRDFPVSHQLPMCPLGHFHRVCYWKMAHWVDLPKFKMVILDSKLLVYQRVHLDFFFLSTVHVMGSDSPKSTPGRVQSHDGLPPKSSHVLQFTRLFPWNVSHPSILGYLKSQLLDFTWLFPWNTNSPSSSWRNPHDPPRRAGRWMRSWCCRPSWAIPSRWPAASRREGFGFPSVLEMISLYRGFQDFSLSI